MIATISILIGIALFHTFVYPIIQGFYDGYQDAINGRPYRDDFEEE